ncbi:MAG: hypothetical protein J6129_01785, partial [Bacteroidaceae bacterium]|nr:hypothetical protein [Bacteroidaceae bacterium]
MKKIFTLCLVAAAAMFVNKANAQVFPEATTIEGSDNVLTILVESTEDLTNIPVTLYLTNPTNEITAVEATLVAPVDVKKFVFSEEDEDFVY